MSLTPNGYIVFDCGLIIQWGAVDPKPVYNYHDTVVIFPIQFTSLGARVIAVTGESGYSAFIVSEPNISSVRIHLGNQNGTASYYAIGW